MDQKARHARSKSRPDPGRTGSGPGKATRDKLIDAALVAFAEHGFRGASVREIGEAVGMTFPLVTYHFGSKENLWLAVAERALSEIVELGQSFEIPDDSDPRERMQAYFRMTLQDSTRHPERRRILAQISARNEKSAIGALAPLLAEFQQRSTERIQRLIDMGFPTRLTAKEVQMVLRGLLASNASAPLGAAALFGFRSSKALVEFQTELLMKIITNGK